MDSFFDAILNVIAIIGIIAIGVFIVFFLSSVLFSILNPEKVQKIKKEKNKDEGKNKEQDLNNEIRK